MFCKLPILLFVVASMTWWCGSCALPVSAIQEREGDVQIGELERRMEGIRAERAQVLARLEAARQEGAERRVAELEQQIERLQQMAHRGEVALDEARARRAAGRAERPHREPLRNDGAPEHVATQERAWHTRLEHAEAAVGHLREAGLADLAEMAARRTKEMRQERQLQADRQAQHRDVEQRERARHEAEIRHRDGAEGPERADGESARLGRALRGLNEQIEALRREVDDLKRRMDR